MLDVRTHMLGVHSHKLTCINVCVGGGTVLCSLNRKKNKIRTRKTMAKNVETNN